MDKASMRPKPIPPPKPALRLSGHSGPESSEKEDIDNNVERPVSGKVGGAGLASPSSNHIYNEINEQNNNEGITPMLNNKTDKGTTGLKTRLSDDGGLNERAVSIGEKAHTSVLLSPKPALLPKPQTRTNKCVSLQPKTPILRPPVPRRPDTSDVPDTDLLKKESQTVKSVALSSGEGISSRRNAKFSALALKAPVAKPEEFDSWLGSGSPVRPPRSPKAKLFLEGPFEKVDEKPELPIKKRMLLSGNNGKNWEVAKKRSSSLGRSGNTNFLVDGDRSGSLGRNLSLMDPTRISSVGPIPPPRRRNKSEEIPRPELSVKILRSESIVDDRSNFPIYAQVNYETKKNRRSNVDKNVPRTPQESQVDSQNPEEDKELVIDSHLVLHNSYLSPTGPPSASVGAIEAAAGKELPQVKLVIDSRLELHNSYLAPTGPPAASVGAIDAAAGKELPQVTSETSSHSPVPSNLVSQGDQLFDVIANTSPSVRDSDSSMGLKHDAFNSDLFSKSDLAGHSKLPENSSHVDSEEARETVAPIPSQLHRLVSQQSLREVSCDTEVVVHDSMEVSSEPVGNLSQLHSIVNELVVPDPSPRVEGSLSTPHCITESTGNEHILTENKHISAVCVQGIQSTRKTDSIVNEDGNLYDGERPVSACEFPDVSSLVITESKTESLSQDVCTGKALSTSPSLPATTQMGTRLWRRQSWSSSKDTTPSPERGLSSSVRKPKHHRQGPWCDEGELSNGALADSDTSSSDNTHVLHKLSAWLVDSFGKGSKKHNKDRKQRTSSFFCDEENVETVVDEVLKPAPPVPSESGPADGKTDGASLDETFKDSESANEDESKDVLDHGTEPKEQRKEKNVFYIARELMTSEKEFVEVLRLLNVQFLKAVDTAAGVEQNPVIPKADFSKIINTLPQLQKLNEDLLRDLESRIENWSSYPKIADVIVKTGPFLKLYSSYIQNFESQCNFLDDCCQKYPRFAKVVKEFEASPCCRKLNVKHFMLKPVQRIPQYRLLLEEYLRHLDVDSPDFRDTEEALRIIRDVADHANRSVKLGNHPSKLIELQSQLSNYEIIKPGRQVVKEGELFKLSRKGRHPRYLILLNDCLLYTSKSNTSLIRVNNELPLSGMKVSLSKAEGYQSEFSIISITRSFTLSASSAEECRGWIDALQNAIKDHTERQLTFQNTKLTPKKVVNEDDVQPFILGRQPPVWIQDGRVTMCQSCTTPFTVMFRRHHCRACGKVVCSICSDNRAPLHHLKFLAARVCEECHDALLQEMEDPTTKILETMMEITGLTDLKEASETMRSLFKKSAADGKKKIMLLKKEIPQRLKEVAANDSGSQMSGWLQRRGRRSWKRLWFVLKEQVLYVYKASEDVVALESIPVLGYKVEPMTERHFQIYEGIDARLVFQLAHSGQLPLVFYAESEPMANRWMQSMQEATVLK